MLARIVAAPDMADIAIGANGRSGGGPSAGPPAFGRPDFRRFGLGRFGLGRSGLGRSGFRETFAGAGITEGPA
jgi:hypothetical protein